MVTQILVVEDEAIVAEDIRRTLKRLGYSVPSVASSGEEAIKKAGEYKPDLVMMDIVIKGKMDGIETAQQMHSLFNIPVIYMTAYSDKAIVERAKITEPFGYIIKPFKEKDLDTTIEMALFKHSTEKKLKESKEWLSTTLKSISDAVIATDQEGCVKFMNPVAQALTGWRAEDAVKKPLKDVFCILNGKNGEPAGSGGAVKDYQTMLMSRGGTQIPVEINSAPIKDDKGDIAGTVIIFKDITERKRAEEALRQANIELKKADKLKTQFLSVSSHELRTPLTPMRAQLQMVLAGYLGEVTENQKKSLEMILRNTTRLDRLIGDILDISKLEAGVMKFNMAGASLAEIVESAVETMRPQARDKNIKLALKKASIPEVVVDKDRITQVVLNLVSNAIKFTDAGGTIEVELSGNSSHAIVKVRDNGIGIKKEDQEKLFTPFQQADSSESRKYEGTGLGLAICKKIITYHGGIIWLESEYGKGTTLQFTIPYKYEVKEGDTGANFFEKIPEKEV